jgi:CysZ protein
LLRLPRAWPLACVPLVVFLFLEAAFVYYAVTLVQPWVERRLTGHGAWLDGAGIAVAWLSTLVVAALGWLASLWLAPPLSAPALERLVALVEAELRAPPRAAQSFVAEFACGLRSMALASALTLPVLTVLTLLELVAPPVALVATPLKLLLGALGLAFGLFDYPLTLRGVGARERLRFTRRNLPLVLGFGSAFTLVAMVPCAFVVLLPVGVVAATRLFWETERAASLSGARLTLSVP